MDKLLLILVLVTTQFLAGIGRSHYLCIGTDGSYCCIDSGAASCTCCKHEDRHVACGDRHGLGAQSCDTQSCDTAKPCGKHHEEGLPGDDQQDIAAVDACECTHLLLSADQRIWVNRISTAIDSDHVARLVALLPCVIHTVAATDGLLAHWTGPPMVPDSTLTMVATVVIRC